jgi:hypothetical protein
MTATGKTGGLKEKAAEELRLWLLISAYLFVFFGAFLTYRRLISRELGLSYLRWGYALVEALVVAKVILIGKALGLDKKAGDKPVILSVLRASVVYGVLVGLFEVLEHVVEGLVHGKALRLSFEDFLSQGAPELLAKTLMLFVAFLPFFAFWEVARVVGGEELFRLFFKGGTAEPRSGAMSQH